MECFQLNYFIKDRFLCSIGSTGAGSILPVIPEAAPGYQPAGVYNAYNAAYLAVATAAVAPRVFTLRASFLFRLAALFL
jgi:hypothetical protein